MTNYSFLQSIQEQWGPPEPLVTEDLTGTIVLIITGANIGLGFVEGSPYAFPRRKQKLTAFQ